MGRLLLSAIVALAGGPAFAGELTWHFYKDDPNAGALAVVDSDEIESPEPHYPFLLSCSADQEWSMYVSDIDHKELGETIARGDQPTFAIAATTAGKEEKSGEFFPEIAFGQMEGVWEYSSIWDLGLLDHLAGADSIAIRGTGISVALPVKEMKASIAAFKDFCGAVGAGDGEGPDASPDDGSDTP
ncbi:MAG TPA: hypothetical protein VFB16_11890 [Bauldia sp.]|nr:hypothetical protein [Bauldia sp.]